MLLERIFIASLLVFAMGNLAGNIVPIFVFSFIGIYMFFKRPHKKSYQTFRVILNMSITVIILIIYAIYGSAEDSQKSQPIFLYLPLLVCILLLVCVIYSSVGIFCRILILIKNLKIK
jgi:predicted ferric reductase